MTVELNRILSYDVLNMIMQSGYIQCESDVTITKRYNAHISSQTAQILAGLYVNVDIICVTQCYVVT